MCRYAFQTYQSVQASAPDRTRERMRLQSDSTLTIITHYGSASPAASVITTNRCISHGVRASDLIWSCCPGILTSVITAAKQQHFTRAGMFGPQTDEKTSKRQNPEDEHTCSGFIPIGPPHQFWGFTVKTLLKEENYGLRMYDLYKINKAGDLMNSTCGITESHLVKKGVTGTGAIGVNAL